MAFTGLENLVVPESGLEGYFVVGLADILGQRARLLAYGDPPPEGLANREKLAALRSETLGVVRKFRKDFHDQFLSYLESAAKSPLNLNSGPVSESLDSLDSAPIGVHAFSDLVALSLCLRSEKKQVPMLGVFLMLASFGMAGLCSLYRGQPVRGGIELDVAWPIMGNDIQNEIYGPALAKAYHLEDEVAGYPRIVVGKNLGGFIDLNAELPDSDDVHQNANRQYAALTRRLLVADNDGQTVINPYNDWYRETNPELHRQLTERSLEFANTEHKRFESLDDNKLMLRYARLTTFIQKHGVA